VHFVIRNRIRKFDKEILRNGKVIANGSFCNRYTVKAIPMYRLSFERAIQKTFYIIQKIIKNEKKCFMTIS